MHSLYKYMSTLDPSCAGSLCSPYEDVRKAMASYLSHVSADLGLLLPPVAPSSAFIPAGLVSRYAYL
jgi:hypothetical protein